MAGQADELGDLTEQHDKLESEQVKLLVAHYADAIPLTLLKKEQARAMQNLLGFESWSSSFRPPWLPWPRASAPA